MSASRGGWAGQILRLDLTGGSARGDPTSRYLREYIGGKGIATRIAWEELAPGTGPYDPGNLLMFMTGPFSGTLAPTSGKGSVCAVSPRTLPDPWFTYGGMGGNWTPELKYAGFDGIVFAGIADAPVYLWVQDGRAELRPADDLWGKDVFATQELLKERHGKAAQVICIGPGGENRAVSATIHHRQKNCAGMAGFGAVMGSKNLKAIVIRGKGAVPIADPATFVAECKRVHNLVHAGPTETPVRAQFGPANIPCAHACPFGCAYRSHDVAFRLGGGRKNISVMCNGEAYEGGWEWYQYPSPDIAAGYHGDVRTRAVDGLGKQAGDELQLQIEALGLSGWTYLTLHCWFLACLDHGVTRLGELTLRPADLDFWLELFRKIAYRDGIGDVLADGLASACRRLDLPEIVRKTAHWLEPMWGFPSHRDGRACEPQPSPLWVFDMLHWAIDSRDPLASHHQTGYIHCWFPPHFAGGSAIVDHEKLEATFTRAFKEPGILEPGLANLDAKTRVTKWFDDRAQLKDSLLLCDWVFPRVLNGFDSTEQLQAADDYYGDIDAEARMLAPLTGIDFTSADLDLAGERIRNLDRALQIRNSGRSRALDSTAEWVFEYPEKSDGTRLDRAEFERIVDSYYEARGWDRATGWPTRKKLEELGLADVADELDGLNREARRSADAVGPDRERHMTIYGYMGRLLFVDLGRREARVEALDEQVARDFLGGYGLGARILYEKMPAGVDPLGPENLLGFVTGPFTGTPAICSGRFTVVGKSPLTGGWGDANCGGVWGPYLRFSGYDAVFFSGIAGTPTYVVIDDGEVTFHDAAPVWGKDCLDTEDDLKAAHGRDTAVACIGPAGEAVSLLSCIITDKGRAAARSGLGAVMGAKKLKAIVVRGTQTVPIPDEALAKQLRQKWARQLMGEGLDFRIHGTTSRTVPNTVIGDTPLKNWVGTYPAEYPDASLDKIDENAFSAERDKPYGCWHCHIRCGGHLKAKPGRAHVSHVPEYETIAMSGPLCQNDDLESIVRFNDLCNAYGLDTISVGGAIAFAMECFEHGLISAEEAGMPLRFGDGDVVVSLTERIARREGIGELLADGVMRAAERLGRGAEEFAVHAGGQELSAHDPRFYPSLALVYRLDATPGRHPRGGSSWIMGNGFMEAPADKYEVAGIGESHKRASAMCHVMSACGNCLFAYTSHPTGYIPEFLSALTGHDHDFESCVKIGERIEDMRHLFNLREGYNPLTITVNQRSLGRPPLEAGATAGITLDEEAMIDEYCAAMEWDRKTAMPSRRKLEELGLDNLVAQHGGIRLEHHAAQRP